MIDLTSEDPITLRDATKLSFLRRNGRRPNLATLYRWSQIGLKGHTLECVQIGASRCTTREAVLRFIERLTNGTSGATVTTVQRRRAIARAERELREDGIG
ncbi:MAG: hypothetical protein JWO31_1702 [Phycisphaerales bacterium]|nr:hypothetical protein [Phycisphaerales bacterium]